MLTRFDLHSKENSKCIFKLPIFVLFSFLCERKKINSHFHAAKILKPIIIKLVFLNCCYCLLAKLCPLFTTQWTVACQAPLSLGFPRQEYWIGLPFPSPVDLPGSGIKPAPPALADRCFTAEPAGKEALLVFYTLPFPSLL